MTFLTSIITCNTTTITSHTTTFFALPGKHTDNSLQWATLAANKGISNIIAWQHICKKLQPKYPTINFITSHNPAYDYTLACQQLFYPVKKHIFIAITGTKGKTSTAFLLHKMLGDCLYIGTLGVYSNGILLHTTTLTTPLAEQFYQIIAAFSGKYIVFEYSSIGLDGYRVIEEIDLGIFTNFTADDHLIYHGTIANYLACKLLLKAKQYIISDQVANILKHHTINTLSHTISLQQTSSTLTQQHITIINEQEKFWNTNLIMAQKASQILTGTYSDISTNIPGRLDYIATINNNPIIIDYAHTPASLQKLLACFANKHIILIFGCGGNRDHQKRPIMGSIAYKHCHTTIITDDNPRHESPANIAQQIINHITNTPSHTTHHITYIPNRQTAIEHGIKLLATISNGVLLIIGKGIETYQIIGDTKQHFDERTIIHDTIKQIL